MPAAFCPSTALADADPRTVPPADVAPRSNELADLFVSVIVREVAGR